MNPVARALLWSLIIVGIAVGAIWQLSGREKGGLESRAVAFFGMYWSEDFGVADTMLTRAMLSPDKRNEYEQARKYHMRTLGTWAGTYDVISVESDGDGGGQVDLELTFEKGTASAHVDMIVVLGELKIADFVMAMPRPANSKVAWHDPRNFASKLMLLWSEGHVDGIWKQFSKRMRRRYPLEIFRTSSKAFRADVGVVSKVDVTDVDDSGKDHAVVTGTITFENGPRSATIEVRWFASRWRVERFEIEGLK